MKSFWAVFFLLLAPLGVHALDPLPAWSGDSLKAWWTQHPTPAQWPQAVSDLRAQLDADYQKNGSAVFAQPDFQGWMDHLEWIQLGLNATDLLAKPENLQAFIALGNDDKLSHQLVEKMVPQDAPSAALALLIRLAQSNLADLHEYAALGVAFCLVFDQPFPDDWPHYQVAQSAVPIGDLDVVARFNFYVASNRNRKTDEDLTQLPFEDLIHVVDSEVKLSELAYAQTKTFPDDHFSDAYFSITYATARITPGSETYDWPLNSYLLKDIETTGGICIDQSYYASLVGKGRGIPTIMFSGAGTDSNHAWFGYLDRSGKWQLDCGRYENGGFVKGLARDPQTWTDTKDTLIAQFAANGLNNPNYPAAETGLAWARLHGNDPSARAIYDDARTVMPELAATWEAEGQYLDSSNAAVEDQKTFYQAWIDQFSATPDLKVEGQKHLLAALKKAADPEADNLQQDIILQNRSQGIDLSVQGSAETVMDRLQAHDWDGARTEFERAIRDFADQGGSTFFRFVVWPYVQTCLSDGRLDQADAGLHFAEERIHVNPTSQLGENFGKLDTKLADEKKAVAAAESWLGELDNSKADQAWSDAAPGLQAASPSDKWTATIGAARQQTGNLVSRTLTGLSLSHEMQIPGSEPIHSDFVIAQYTTVFDAKPNATETVVFEKTGADKWQALSYDCR
jgi:hypothetical protein